MPHSAAVPLACLLLGALGVGAVPLDKGEHPEEMVARCILEVLSYALAKPNAPPIDSECREILRKSTRLNNEKDSEVKRYDTGNLKMMMSADKNVPKLKEETGQHLRETNIQQEQAEEKRHHDHVESHEEREEDGKEKKNHSVENEEDTGHSKEGDLEDADEERGTMVKKDKVHSDESQEMRHEVFDKKAHAGAKSAEELSEEDEEPRNSQDLIKRQHGGTHWREQLKRPEERSDETSDESKENEEKRSYKSKLSDLGQRISSYEEKRRHQDEQRNHIDLHEEQPYARIQKSYYGLNSFDDHEKDTHHEDQSSEETKEKRHFQRSSEEEREEPYTSEESNEKEPKRHHYEDEESRPQQLRKRWPSTQNSEKRFNYRQGKEGSDESTEDIDKRHSDRDEKQKLYDKIRHRLQADEEERPFSHDVKDDKRHYIGEEMVDEMKRYYPDYSEEKEKRHYDEELKKRHYGEKKDVEDSNFLKNEKYNQHSSEERRSGSHYGLTNDQLKWKKYFEDDGDNNNILDSEEDRKRSMQSKNILPEYNDYDWWAKKQFLEDMNHGYGEKGIQPKVRKLDEKRQYDRMDELAQLLNYKKKSVEIPDFYDSEEIKKRNYNERDRLSQRPLTEEEEKELENLAIMDMELQKIAEKLTNNRQG
uniref:Secretogranin-1 n=1 Tax=Leptobrachium leishanense TaxID=445787 RepID=A0A8C5N0S5_9ANUR